MGTYMVAAVSEHIEQKLDGQERKKERESEIHFSRFQEDTGQGLHSGPRWQGCQK